MTLAKRVIPIVDFLPGGAPFEAYTRGGMEVKWVETVVAFHAKDGADEVWLRLRQPDKTGARGLFEPLKKIRPSVHLPLVVWGAVATAADARLLIGLGADRVVIEIDDDTGLKNVEKIADSVGPDHISAAVRVRRAATESTTFWEQCAKDGTGMQKDARTAMVDLARHGAGELVLLPSLAETRVGSGIYHDAELVDAVAGVLPQQIVSISAADSTGDLAHPLRAGADAVAAQTLFASGSVTLRDAKTELATQGIGVRPAIPPYIS